MLLPGRLLAAVGEHQVLDTDLTCTPPGPSLTLAHDGVRLSLDVADAVDAGSGTLDAHFRVALDAAVLARLPGSATVTVANAMPALLKGWKGQWSA